MDVWVRALSRMDKADEDTELTLNNTDKYDEFIAFKLCPDLIVEELDIYTLAFSAFLTFVVGVFLCWVFCLKNIKSNVRKA